MMTFHDPDKIFNKKFQFICLFGLVLWHINHFGLFNLIYLKFYTYKQFYFKQYNLA